MSEVFQIVQQFLLFLTTVWAAVTTVLWTLEKRKAKDLTSAVMTDGLTGLQNARGLEASIRMAVSHAIRFQETLVVLYLDANKFKQVNDTYGHDIGNHLLMAIGRTLRATFARASDILGRQGGDEFVVCLVGTSADGAVQAIRRLIGASGAVRVDLPDATVVSSLAIGGVTLQFEKDSAKVGRRTWDLAKCRGSVFLDEVVAHMLREADQAMYAAKVEAHKDLSGCTSVATLDGTQL